MTATDAPRLAERRIGLERRLAEVKNRLAAIEAELDSHVERDWEEAATEREGDEVLEAEGRNRRGQAECLARHAVLPRLRARGGRAVTSGGKR